jgi:hypothetical protein
MSVFKLIGPLNPPKKGKLIMLTNEDASMAATGVIVNASVYTRSGIAMIPNDNVLFFARKEWEGQTNSNQYSPFGDTGYELEIVWTSETGNRREFWMLAHPEPTCLGRVNVEESEELETEGGVAVRYNELQNTLRVLVA